MRGGSNFVASLALVFLFISGSTCKPCDYATGHGLVIVPSPSCSHFLGHHLGEFECPHQYDVKISFTFASQSDQSTFCRTVRNRTQTTYTMAPEVVLPQLAAGVVSTFTSDIYDGFFGATIMSNVTFLYERTVFFMQYGLLRPPQLTYLLLPEDDGQTLLLWHYVSTPPDFDHLLRVSSSYSFPKVHGWALAVQFANLSNNYDNRLAPGKEYAGIVNGTTVSTFKVISNIYPGTNRYNGDGRTDFVQYCVEPNRPKWNLCP
jgi:hypothetical protein